MLFFAGQIIFQPSLSLRKFKVGFLKCWMAGSPLVTRFTFERSSIPFSGSSSLPADAVALGFL